VSLLVGDFHLVTRASDVYASAIVVLVAAVAGSFIPAYLAVRTRIIDVLRATT
jgi:ABC-type antimicrobial peptide transport system permease subunit